MPVQCPESSSIVFCTISYATANVWTDRTESNKKLSDIVYILRVSLRETRIGYTLALSVEGSKSS